MRVLITGADGQLGRDLQLAFGGHEVVATDRAELDVADRDCALQVIAHAGPEAVVHAAAQSNVDGCETDPDEAFRINALGTRHVVEGARLAGARVCYVSTDYVFDGTAGRAYTEWDQPNPLSVYGRSKLGGEWELDDGDTVVRTSWLSGRHGHNFVRTVLERAGRGEELRVVDDQHGCPTFTPDLAEVIRRLVVARLTGVWHVTNQGATTWFALARDTLLAAGLDRALVTPIATDEMQPPRPAPRPAYSVLDNAALRLSGLPLLPDHHEPLARLVKELVG